MKIASTLGLVVFLLSASCSTFRVGDGAVRIVGTLAPEHGTIDDCILELRYASEDFAFRSLSVSGSFDRTFTISPRSRTYYVVVNCTRAGEVHRSEPFRVKDIRYLREPLDLGRIPV